jgi:dephospho-CoA kinase
VVKMLKVGLTGGIAAGKTVVGEMFAAHGVSLIDADDLARALLQPGEAVYAQVVGHFGSGILNPDGSINRARLAETAFGSSADGIPARVQELNQIVHPVVVQRQEEWMAEVGRRNPQAIAMVEAALIVEAGAAKRFDRLILVTCSLRQRIQRWAGKMQVDEERARREVTRRLAAQLPDAEKAKAAHYVIDNSGPLETTRKQVDAVYESLQREAREKTSGAKAAENSRPEGKENGFRKG